MFKTGAISQTFCSKTANFRPLRIHQKSTQTVAQEVRNLFGVWRRFRELGGISRTFQIRPCSKAWAIAQEFCSNTTNFRPLRIHPKSAQTVAEAATNLFRTVLEAFSRAWSDVQNLPKSAMFKTMGYSGGFLLKIRQFSTLANSCQIDTSS